MFLTHVKMKKYLGMMSEKRIVKLSYHPDELEKFKNKSGVYFIVFGGEKDMRVMQVGRSQNLYYAIKPKLGKDGPGHEGEMIRWRFYVILTNSVEESEIMANEYAFILCPFCNRTLKELGRGRDWGKPHGVTYGGRNRFDSSGHEFFWVEHENPGDWDCVNGF